MINPGSLLLLIPPFFGFVVLRAFLGLSSFIYLLPFSFVFGFASLLVLEYGLAYFFGIQKAAFIALAVLLVIALILCAVYRKEILKIEIDYKPKEFIILFFICFLIAFFTYLLSEKWIILDFRFHVSVASHLVSTDKFPQAVSNWPTLLIPYHYGFDLLSALIVKLTNISVINSFHLIGIASSVITFLSCFALSYFFSREVLNVSKNFIPVLFSALLFYFAGNLLWLDALLRHFLRIVPVEEGWSLFQSFCALGMHGSIMNDLGGSGILFPSSTLGIQLFLLLFFLYFRFLKLNVICPKSLVCIFIVSLILFHTAEWILYVFLLALVLSMFFSLRSFFVKNLACFFIIVFVIVFNNVAYKILSEDYSYLPSFLEFSLNPNLFSLKAFGRFGDLNQHRLISLFSWDFISEFGFQLMFLPFVVYWLIRKKITEIAFILSFLLVSFISPFFLYIKSSPPDSIRLFHPGFELLSLLFGLWIFDFKKPFLVLFPSVVILPSILTLALSSIFSPGIYLSHQFIDYVNFAFGEYKKDKDIKKFFKDINQGISILKQGSVIGDSDIEIANYLKTHSKIDEYGISTNPLPFDYAGIPCYSIRGTSLPRRVTFVTLLHTLDPYLIKELKIRWLYVEPNTARLMDIDLLEELMEKNILKEVLLTTSPLSKDVKLRLFEFIDMEKYLETYPRKAYWTFFTYLDDNIVPINDAQGKGTVCLFQSEKEATSFLKNQIKIDKEFKSYKPNVNAIDIFTLENQAKDNNLTLRVF